MFLCLIAKMSDWCVDMCSSLSSQLTTFVKNYLRWNVVLSIWSWKQTTKFARETANVPTTQESLHVKITNEDNANHFLQFQGYCTIWIHSKKTKQSIKFIMWKYWSSYMKLCVEKGLNFCPVIGFSTMTMLQFIRYSLPGSFLSKNWLLEWNTHPIPII